MTIVLDVIICTYNRASELDRTLAALASQSQAEDMVWSVLVVDNGSTDATAQVVESWRARGSVPGLRSLLETERGLSPARLRGVRETNAEWIAFVDDDNLLATDWIAGVGQAVAAHPGAGGFGGKVIIDWISPCPDYLKNFGWCFAEQDHGAEMCEIDNLTGAGMVLRRKALEASGWVQRPLLADRTGERLISGGDVEMVQRIRGAGYKLWYAPQFKLWHRIPAERTTRRYLLLMNYGLGKGAAAINALGWVDTYETWALNAKGNIRLFARRALQRIALSIVGRDAAMAGFAEAAFAIGFARGVAAVRAMPCQQRVHFIGAARKQND
jgi:glycosyltransferase involved in cell wall biosynthesis